MTLANKEIKIDVKTVKKFFKKGKIRKIAKKSGFIQRNRKLDAFEFFITMTFGSLKSATVTLDGMAENLSESISKAGISQRFNEYAFAFLSEVFSFFFRTATENGSNIDIDVLNQFDRINIIDSSSWKIPDGLEPAFPGYNRAGCKIQLMYDYKTGVIQLFDITEQTRNDQSYSKTMDDRICRNDLLIFDMGYSIADFLDMIHEREAFFISRYNYSAVNLYVLEDGAYKETDISDVLKKLNDSETIFEFECYAGNKEKKVRIRFFAVRVPEEVANERRRKKYQNAKKKGRTPAKKALRLCDWDLLMTNIPAEKGINAGTVLAFYPIRWSSELFFKQFKSVLSIHKTEVKTNEYRLRCEVTGKAIVAMFISFCYSKARFAAWRISGKETSIDKTVKYFKRNIGVLTAVISGSGKKTAKHVRKMITEIIRTCCKERQKTRKNSLDALTDGSVYEKYRYKKISLENRNGIFTIFIRFFNFVNINLFIEINELTS